MEPIEPRIIQVFYGGGGACFDSEGKGQEMKAFVNAVEWQPARRLVVWLVKKEMQRHKGWKTHWKKLNKL